ncbi:MAG: hypothetical protein ACKO6B_11205 [Planctomycetia bacterium]
MENGFPGFNLPFAPLDVFENGEFFKECIDVDFTAEGVKNGLNF